MGLTGSRSSLVRVAWAMFAVLGWVYGVAVGMEPLYQVTSCEVIDFDAACADPLFAHYGWRLVAVVVGIGLICLLPVIKPVRAASWSAAGALTFGLVASSWTFGSALFLYYVPIALVALLMAASHRRLAGGPRGRQVSAIGTAG